MDTKKLRQRILDLAIHANLVLQDQMANGKYRLGLFAKALLISVFFS